MRLQENELALRRYLPEDRDRLVLLANNPNVAKYLADRFPSPYYRENAESWIKMARAEKRVCNFAVEWRGELIGGAGLVPLEDMHSGTAEIGYWLAEPYWGVGLATRVVALLAPYGLEELLFIRLQAMVFAENAPSMRVLEKNAFRREGVMRKHIRKNGTIHDAVLYARLRNP